MATSEPQAYRLFTFHLDGRLTTLVLFHRPGLSPQASAAELYHRFHAIMEREAPGCFGDGRISHLGYVDGWNTPEPQHSVNVEQVSTS